MATKTIHLISKFLVRYSPWIGLLLLPLLFSLTAYFILNNLQIDIDTRSIVKAGYLQISGTSQAQIYIDNELKGNTSQTIIIPLKPENNTFFVEIKSKDNRTWAKNIKISENLASIYYPILYPEKFKFEKFSEANNVYYSQNSDFIFFTKQVNDKLFLYKLYPHTLLLNTEIKETLFADITDLIIQENKYKIVPGNTGNKVALITDQSIIFLNEDKSKLSVNIKLLDNNKYYWAKSDSLFIIENSNEIIAYSMQGNNLLPTILYRIVNSNESIELQYISEDYLVFKSIVPERIKLYQVTYSGKLTEIDLPNFDNIKINNLEKAYDFTEKTSQIILETDKNIYLLNVNNFDFRKVNLYENEKIFTIDKKNQIIITYNKKANTQFRLYDQTKLENTSFTIENISNISDILDYSIFNNGQNLLINLKDQIILIDADGYNKKIINKELENEKIIKIYKNNLNIFLIKVKPILESKNLNKLEIEISSIEN